MATNPDALEAGLDIRGQIVPIDMLIANAGQPRQQTRFGPVIPVFSGMGAAVAFFAAGIAFAKLVVG